MQLLDNQPRCITCSPQEAKAEDLTASMEEVVTMAHCECQKHSDACWAGLWLSHRYIDTQSSWVGQRRIWPEKEQMHKTQFCEECWPLEMQICKQSLGLTLILFS
jgi:hypothetical protein